MEFLEASNLPDRASCTSTTSSALQRNTVPVLNLFWGIVRPPSFQFYYFLIDVSLAHRWPTKMRATQLVADKLASIPFSY